MNKNKYTTIFLLGILAYVFFHTVWFFCHGVILNVDSIKAYIPQSTISFFSKDFFIGANYIDSTYPMKARAYSYPLYLKLFSHTERGFYLATVGQFLISLFAWFYFAFTIFKKIAHKKIALLAFFSILLMSLTNAVIVWDRIIAAESLTISFYILILTLFFKWSDNYFKSSFYLILLVLASTFFAGLRDTNPYFLLLLSMFTLGYTLIYSQYSRLHALIFFFIMIILFFGNNIILEKSERWQAPFAATFIGRLLCQSNQSAIQYFQDKYQMPVVSEDVRKFRGTVYGWTYILSKEPLAEWMRQSGKKAYTHYLLTHPYYTWIVPLSPIKNHFDQCKDLTKNIFEVRSGFKTIDGKVHELDYQRSLWLALISTYNFSVNLAGAPTTSWITILLIPIVDIMCVIALIGLIQLSIRNRKIIYFSHINNMFSLFLLISGIILAFFIWHADSTAYPRHLVSAMLQLALSSLLLFFFVWDQVQVEKEQSNIDVDQKVDKLVSKD